MDENQRIKESIKQLSFTKRLEHIWFYYKWFILFGLCVLTFVCICLTQCIMKVSPDAMVMYAGDGAVGTGYHSYVDSAFSEVMREDYNGDGHKKADFLQITIKPNGKNPAMDFITEQEAAHQRFYTEWTTGASCIYLLDETTYAMLDRSYLMTLEEALGYTPDEAIDEYTVDFSALPCYNETSLSYLPKNALLCIRRKRVDNFFPTANDSDEYYDANLAYFADLIEYLPEQE